MNPFGILDNDSDESDSENDDFKRERELSRKRFLEKKNAMTLIDNKTDEENEKKTDKSSN